MEHEDFERSKVKWEQRFTAIANAVAVAAILFLGTQVWTTNTKLTEFSITNMYLADTVKELKSQIKDLNMSYVNKSEFKDLDIRVRKLEGAK